ncbi:MAG: 50S ribosomal protein L13 [Simkaniaceae bacterium]|nr:50S ribosomal protein L13 [Simkaniaceae bacterium]
MSNPKKRETFFVTNEAARENRGWILVDAAGKTLGRLSTEIATILSGKHKTTFTPHIDDGDGVIVINATGVKVTGSKEAQKTYKYYTGKIGGLREIPYRVMKQNKPEFIITHAVKGMMPKTKQAKAQLKRLRVFAGDDHQMEAQKPLTAAI